MQRLNSNSVRSPLITSSVIIDKYGSININMNIVEILLITDAKVLQVVLKLGLKHPAYNDDKILTLDIENAIMFSKIIFLGVFLKFLNSDKFSLLGIEILFLKEKIYLN